MSLGRYPITLIFSGGSSMSNRTATVKRDTKETQIEVSLNLDGEGKSDLEYWRAISGTHDRPDRAAWNV